MLHRNSLISGQVTKNDEGPKLLESAQRPPVDMLLHSNATARSTKGPVAGTPDDSRAANAKS